MHIAIDSYFFFERDNFKILKDFFESKNVDNDIYKLTPFSHEINPRLPNKKPIIPFGCIEFVQEVIKQGGDNAFIFYDEDVFTNENCLSRWGEMCLNSDAKIMTINEIRELDPEKQYFIRPLEDLKTFTGNLFQPGMMKSLVERYGGYENNTLNMETRVIVASPKSVIREWRNFIVDGKVVSSSLYRENGRHKEGRENIPTDMILFCQEALKIYIPSKAFVLDICQTEDNEFKIVEFGCIHNCGFYQADVEKVLGEILQLFEEKSV